MYGLRDPERCVGFLRGRDVVAECDVYSLEGMHPGRELVHCDSCRTPECCEKKERVS